jgi:formiminoglutamate deiminase
LRADASVASRSASCTVRHFFADLGWLGEGPLRNKLLLQVVGEHFSEVEWNVQSPPADAVRLNGLVLPGLANSHSHAFHRALRGRVQGDGDFWSWREVAYRYSDVLDPKLYLDLATATYAEMMLAGITAVGEFHYVHHDRGGAHYADPNEMGRVLIQAGRRAGLRMTLLDTCYLYSGLRRGELGPSQLRFSDRSAEAWAERVDEILSEEGRDVRIGAAVHSVRAVDEQGIRTVVDYAKGRPLHFHLSEQVAENEECLSATGLTPTGVMQQSGALGPSSTAVHATHLTSADVTLLGRSGSSVCFCPTTERDLADGVGPAGPLSREGARLCLGSDSHAVIDLFEEARAVELNERLLSGRRGARPAEALLGAASLNGMRALGWDAGTLAPGHLADFITVGIDSIRMAGAAPGSLLSQVVYAGSAADVRDVYVGGEKVVSDGEHLLVADVPQLLDRVVRQVHTRVAG